MRLHKAPLLIATAALMLLTACGGGGATVLGPGRTVIPGEFEVFALTNTRADTVSTVGGVTLASRDNTVRIVSAGLEHQTGRLLNFTNGLTSVASMEGGGGGWNDATAGGNNTLTLAIESQASLIYSGIFDFTSRNTNGSGATILGVLTPAGTFPTSGTITFEGTGFADGSTASSSQSFSATGVSVVTANFNGQSTVGVRIDFSDNALPFDQIVLSPMVRNGASFAGGSVTMFDGGANVTADILGVNPTSNAGGAFFGLDERKTTLQPREVGGVFVGDSTVSGTTGSLQGGFLATNVQN